MTLSIEFAATAVKSEFNQVKSSGNYDILGTASAGLIFMWVSRQLFRKRVEESAGD